MMLTLGIDIGSTTSKCALLRDGCELVATSLVSAGIGTAGSAKALEEISKYFGDENIAYSAVTGYGRTRYDGADCQISELSCHAIGARLCIPGVRTIIDIGGQDAKVICLSESGKMQNFLMNDKCAAGTGRFLDVMANILQLDIAKLADYAEHSSEVLQISSTCTVFAESEVISQLSNGAAVEDVVAGICESVAIRTAGLAKRQPITAPICMSGGVAQNRAIRNALSRLLDTEIMYDPRAQLFGAIGAAKHAYDMYTKKTGGIQHG